MSDTNQPPVDPNAGQVPPGSPQQPASQQPYGQTPPPQYNQTPPPQYNQPPQQPGQPPQYQAAPAAPLSPSDDKLWATLSMFLNIILLIPALIIYLVFKDRGERVRTESKEALNWTINVTGAVIALQIIAAIIGIIPLVGAIIGLLIGLVIWAILIVNIVFSIIGGVRVNAGGSYQYPWNYRWIK